MRVDADGRFSLELALPQPRFGEPPAWTRPRAELLLGAPGHAVTSTRLVLPLAEPLELRALPESRARLTVVVYPAGADAPHRLTPLALTLEGAEGRRRVRATTDARGRASVDVAPGEWSLRGTLDGEPLEFHPEGRFSAPDAAWAEEAWRVRARAGRTELASARCAAPRRMRTVRVEVVHPDGRPAPDAEVRVLDHGLVLGRPPGVRRLDDEATPPERAGDGLELGLPYGVHEAAARTGFREGAAPVAVRADGPGAVRVVLDRVVQRGAIAPDLPADAFATLYHARPPERVSRAGPWEDVRLGRYWLLVHGERGGSARLPVTVGPGVTARPSIEALEPDVHVGLRVRAPAGETPPPQVVLRTENALGDRSTMAVRLFGGEDSEVRFSAAVPVRRVTLEASGWRPVELPLDPGATWDVELTPAPDTTAEPDPSPTPARPDEEPEDVGRIAVRVASELESWVVRVVGPVPRSVLHGLVVRGDGALVTFSSLPPGRYAIVLEHADLARPTLEVEAALPGDAGGDEVAVVLTPPR